MMMSKVKHSWLMPLMAVAILLGGCVADEGTCPPEGTAKPLTLTLNVKVPVSSVPGTRSEANKTDHKPEAATDAENYISFDEGDYKLIVFGEDGNFLTDDIQMQKASAGATSDDGLYTIHTLVGEIPNPIEKGDNKKEELTTFSLMLLANTEAFTPTGTSYDFASTSIADGNPDNIFTDGTKFNFTMPSPSGGAACWTPVNKQGIPMFGLVNLNLKTANGEWNGDKTGTTLNMVADMPVLRSLAKIEIVDMVPDKSADIDKVVLTKYNTTGRLIPDIMNTENGKWDQLGTQVSSPSLPTPVEEFGTSLTFTQESRNVVIGDNPEEQPKDVFVAYVPEMELTGLTGEDLPVLHVYLKDNSKPYTIYLANYKNGKPETETDGTTLKPYTSLLRNHLYRFNVTNVGVNADLELVIETPEWNVDDDQEWAYEDAAVGFTEEGKFTWKNPNYETILDDPDRILLTGYTEDDASYGSFQFKPVAANNSCTWTLSLIADDDTDNDHFTIQLKDGDEWKDCGDAVTRDLNKEKVEFRIMATAANGSAVDYTARLVMTVQTFDGRVAILNLTGTTTYEPSEEQFYYVVKQLTNGGDNM